LFALNLRNRGSSRPRFPYEPHYALEKRYFFVGRFISTVPSGFSVTSNPNITAFSLIDAKCSARFMDGFGSFAGADATNKPLGSF
jgi:hypothetical protein